MTFAIGITYVPRKTETVRGSVNSLLEVSARHEVDLSFYPDGCEMHHHFVPAYPTPERVGCFRNFARALTHLCESGADVVAVMPDDVLYYPFAFAHISEGLTTQNIGYCAAYTPRLLGQRERMKRGWNEVKGGYYSSYGGGYFFPIDVARAVIAHPFFINHRDNYAPNQQIDHCIPEVVHQLGLRQLFHGPSLIQHVGLTSTIGHKHTSNERPFMR
jgi:hypothetical protein